MGILYENAMALKNSRDERQQLAEAAKQELDNIRNEQIEAREALREAALKKSENFYEYKDTVRKVFVTEALKRIYAGSILNPSSAERKMGDALVEGYVNDKGADFIIQRFKSANTPMMTNLYEAEEEYYEAETKDADMDDPSTMTINRANAGEFIEKTFELEDIDDITNTIRLRVSAAEEEFVNKNQMDNENIKTILSDTKDRIENAKSENDNEYAEEVAAQESAIANDKIYKIRHEGYRNVFHQFVLQLSEAALRSPERSQYIGENGRLDMDKIVEAARCMYTMLEMVNSLRLEVVDEQYIRETLESIK